MEAVFDSPWTVFIAGSVLAALMWTAAIILWSRRKKNPGKEILAEGLSSFAGIVLVGSLLLQVFLVAVANGPQ